MKVICKGALCRKHKECIPEYCYHAGLHEKYEYCDCTLSIKGLSFHPKHKATKLSCMKNKCINENSLEYTMLKVLNNDI